MAKRFRFNQFHLLENLYNQFDLEVSLGLFLTVHVKPGNGQSKPMQIMRLARGLYIRWMKLYLGGNFHRKLALQPSTIFAIDEASSRSNGKRGFTSGLMSSPHLHGLTILHPELVHKSSSLPKLMITFESAANCIDELSDPKVILVKPGRKNLVRTLRYVSAYAESMERRSRGEHCYWNVFPESSRTSSKFKSRIDLSTAGTQ